MIKNAFGSAVPGRLNLKVEGSGHFVIDEKQVKAEER
jgi:hypothetical protein